MKIKGFTPISFRDYPGKISSVVFLEGCNLNCKYCFNRDTLVKAKEISQKEIFSQIENILKKIDGIVITGGEPLINDIRDLRNLIFRLSLFGLPIKLNTNGFFPAKLAILITEGLVDFVSMDLKTSPSKLNRFGASSGGSLLVRKSVEILKESKIPHMFRTVIDREKYLVDDFDLWWIRDIIGDSPFEVVDEQNSSIL